MRGLQAKWEKLGCLLSPSADIPWLQTHAGASVALESSEAGVFDLYVTGRDAENRSRIGRAKLRLGERPRIEQIEPDPVLTLGDPGAFDQNGTSYPCLVRDPATKRTYLYYTGWVPTVLTPFQNMLGLAELGADGAFHRVSRAPILPADNDDYLGIGSVFVLQDSNAWRMWYTSFLSWGTGANEPKHQYLIKYAESEDGRTWRRENKVAIPFQNPTEHSICRPSILRHAGRYHMWFSYRGEHYRTGYAHSEDGIKWTRDDAQAGIEPSPTGWDSEAHCYPHVFRHEERLYMLYSGNDYGRAGLGIARLQL